MPHTTQSARSGLPLALAVLVGGLGCDDPTALERDSDRLIQTEATEYDLDWDGVGWRVDIPYVFGNRTGATVHLPNCSGDFMLYLEREDDEGWSFAWGPVVNGCRSPPIIIESDADFVDTLHVWGAPTGRNVFPQFAVAEPNGIYRIVWIDALDALGEQISLEMRISNRFILRK